ncbi:tetratricopeptide repeat protein [Waterburya agarophytonicola K14]|uniref:Tetratricopeptide repeat protein n=1 Tax=Waterburya agarophytonicola KI4 TaxID=2874699 RepID=A0A964BLD3_9CYAN|nr:tetratricopeptide repeat protein [Waterburya agarophytonicola KI4]
MPKLNWLISLIACAGISSISLPVRGQAVLPYLPKLETEKLESQGLQLLQESVQLIRFQQYDLALPRAELATQLAPENYEVWFILGNLYIQQEELAKGIHVLEKAEALAPDQEGILFSLGNAYFQQGKYEAARTKLEKGLEIEGNSPEALFDLGNTYLKLAQLDEAIESYEEAFAKDATFWPALNNVGLVEYEQSDRTGAISKWESVIQVDGEQAEPQLALAVALFVEGKTEKAIALGKAALKLDNRYADIQFLKDNLWGEQLIEDTKKFLSNPQIQEIVSTSDEATSEKKEEAEIPATP